MADGIGRWIAPGRRETDTPEDTEGFGLAFEFGDAGGRLTAALAGTDFTLLCEFSVSSVVSFFFGRERQLSSCLTLLQHRPATLLSTGHAPQGDCSSTAPSLHRR